MSEHDAEAMAGRGLHDPPGFDLRYARRTQLLKSPHFRIDIVGLDIKMHPAWMRHRLHLDVQSAGRIHQLHVDLPFLAREWPYRQT